MNTLNSFLLTTIAGASTMIGVILIFINKKNIINKALAFASGVMLTVSIIDLIPESLTYLNTTFYKVPSFIIMLIFLNVGVIISCLIDKYIPTNTDGLYRVGIISMLAIILHNIPEGIATFLSSQTNIKLGISLTIAIALHNIPEGISIATPIYYSTKSKKKALWYTFISGISEPFGALIAYLFLSKYIGTDINVMGIILPIIAGIMTHISLFELLPTSLKYKEKKATIIFFIIGSVFMIINHLLFG
ncbi:MAG: ZIP family metal transporter [Bacilli bacterium]|nr:ZIP family metal transporter [Bacilli bacterium]MBP3920050.1 ZIP family metal transporter [Bacilli bacterium]